MKQQMKELFDQITMSEECEMRIEKMLNEHTGKKKFGTKRKVMVAAIAAAALCALPVTAYAATGGNLFHFLSGNGMIFHETQGEDGAIAHVQIDTSKESSLFVKEDGRLYLHNADTGEKIDLTDLLSETEPYIYSSEDSEGSTHYLIIGGTADNYGYAEFIRDAEGLWQGGYSSNAAEQEWFIKGAKELELPWADLIGTTTYTEAEGAGEWSTTVDVLPDDGETVPYIRQTNRKQK